MEFGVHLPLTPIAGEQCSFDDLLAFTEAARDLGYTHLCANDHLVFSRPWLDGPTALAAVLAHSQMTLATTVAVPVLRGPAATAKILRRSTCSPAAGWWSGSAWFLCSGLRAGWPAIRGALEAPGRGSADVARVLARRRPRV